MSVVVVTGVSGSGKSTVGAMLAERLGWPFAEGDALHPPANVAKMARGEALDDADRGPWLDAVADWIGRRLERGESGVISCSALRRRYRDRLAAPGVWFVHLDPSPSVLEARVASRRGHFMPAALLPSQLAALEPLAADEAGVVVPGEGAPQQVVEAIVRALSERGVLG